jgi:endonuclease-3
MQEQVQNGISDKDNYVSEVIRRLKEIIPPGKFKHRDPYHVLIRTILSQRSKDENTDIAANNLFEVYESPEALSNGDLIKIQQLIKPAGLYEAKSRNIKAVANIILDKYSSEVPRTVDEMIKLPGVGRKTANCVMVYGFNEPAIPVDTHVHRISNRLGWVRTKTPEQTEAALTEFLPKKYWIEINELLVRFGQQICRPIGPKCPKCPLKDICPIGLERIKNE